MQDLLYEKIKKKKKVFSTEYSPISEKALTLGRFPDFALCPSYKSKVLMKMSMEHWWNDTDRGKLKYWERDIT